MCVLVICHQHLCKTMRIHIVYWSLIAQSVCQRAFSLLAIWCLRPWVRILHLAEEHEEDNLSPFDSKIACLCQSIEINNNKHIYWCYVIIHPAKCIIVLFPSPFHACLKLVVISLVLCILYVVCIVTLLHVVLIDVQCVCTKCNKDFVFRR